MEPDYKAATPDGIRSAFGLRVLPRSGMEAFGNGVRSPLKPSMPSELCNVPHVIDLIVLQPQIILYSHMFMSLISLIAAVLAIK